MSDPLVTAPPELAAAVDLGSNSFHMLVARIDGGRLVVVDRLKERVQLAGGLDEEGRITPEAQLRALDCLERFGQRLQEMPIGTVRAVGTNTMRQAKNRIPFLSRASKALGHPIEVVSGREEARLIYLGVTDSVAERVPGGRRLVVDIGGGSTEIVIGEAFQPLVAESMYMGCVSYSLRFFPDGVLTEERFEAAFIASRLEMEPHKKRFRSLSWEQALGSSGTMRAIEAILVANGWGQRISRRGVDRLRRAMVQAGHVDRLALAGMPEDRRSILAGGLAIAQGVMRSLRLNELDAATGTIREGALLDLLGRRRHQDARDSTVLHLAERWNVDLLQAARVERTARTLLGEVARGWGLMDPELGKTLAWAARLHEIGLDIAHSGYHKHGAYVLENADLAGFSRQDQQLLAFLVRFHRRKLPPETTIPMPPGRRGMALRLVILLRLSVRLHRGRSDRPLPPIDALVPRKHRLTLRFPHGWLEAHPLSAADLAREQAYQAAVGQELQLQERLLADDDALPEGD